MSFSFCLSNFVVIGRLTDGAVMTSHRTSKWRPQSRKYTSGLRVSDRICLRRWESFTRQNFDRQLTGRQLSTVKPRVMSKYPLLLQLHHQQLFCLRRALLQLIDFVSCQQHHHRWQPQQHVLSVITRRFKKHVIQCYIKN